jgi:alcohol dehydrogenase (cytochrome c)
VSIKCNLAILASLGLAVVAMPALATDVTPQRLLNTAAEPQNWLAVHRDYNNSRHSPLKEVNRDTVKDLKLKFIFSIGGRSTGGTLPGKEESTPLVDDGFMYVSDTYDRVMKFDVRSGTEAVPLWRYDPKITKSRTNRGIAMYGNKPLPCCGLGHRVGDGPVPQLSSTGAVTIAADLTSGGASVRPDPGSGIC